VEQQVLAALRSFDEFLEGKFPESRRKAYYLMAIHEHLTPIHKRELEQIGWTKARELAKVARRDREIADLLRQFQQRRLLSQCEGIVDQDYINKSGDKPYAVGQRLIVQETAVVRAAHLIPKLMES